MTPLSLHSRQGLPDSLRLLLPLYPRADWSDHRNFDGLIAFWLDRHLGFRSMTARMAEHAQAFLDRTEEPAVLAGRLAHLGNRFLQDLHGHHGIEDAHFFPRLTVLEPRLALGFEMLEADHQAIDGVLARFAASANALLRAPADLSLAGGFSHELGAITALLDRHLVDEEDLIVPVILDRGPQAFD